MKKFYLISLCALTVLAVSCKKDNGEVLDDPIPDITNLSLNEIDPVDKNIELFNIGTEEIDLEGAYIIKNDETAEKVWCGEAGHKLAAGAYIVLVGEDHWADDVTEEINVNDPEYIKTKNDNVLLTCGLSPKKSLKIELFNAEGKSMQVFKRGPEPWGTSITDVKDKKNPKSFSRIPNGTGDWKLAPVSLGAANPSEGETIPQE